LLAEDNEINREVATEVLRAIGYECDCVANGVEAVKAAASGIYDLILMDCQMPEMDGFDATATIRRQKGARVPIVALTANAMKGDRERCLAAGMDDYLAKPLEMERVASVIERFLGRSEPRSGGTSPAPPTEVARTPPAAAGAEPETEAAGEPALDYPALLKRCSGNAAFVSRIIEKFSERARADAEEMELAFRENNGPLLASLAHRMKGAGASVSAVALSKAAAGVEASGRAGDLPEAGRCLKRLHGELGRFEQAIEDCRIAIADS
jgi:CheY-like chemotaxis protein/HPt (histidine-containing phosphotransfer) domain-containing protein